MLKICLDPGHGGKDPGAVGPTGVKEADVVLQVAKLLGSELIQRGCVVTYTRSENITLRLADRVKTAKDFGAELFLSLHCNAAVKREAQGMETLFGSGMIRSQKFAGYIQRAMVNAFPHHKDRGLMESPSNQYPRAIYVVRRNSCPAALVELEFISNPEQEKFLNKIETKHNIAKALCEGILEYKAKEM